MEKTHNSRATAILRALILTGLLAIGWFIVGAVSHPAMASAATVIGVADNSDSGYSVAGATDAAHPLRHTVATVLAPVTRLATEAAPTAVRPVVSGAVHVTATATAVRPVVAAHPVNDVREASATARASMSSTLVTPFTGTTVRTATSLEAFLDVGGVLSRVPVLSHDRDPVLGQVLGPVFDPVLHPCVGTVVGSALSGSPWLTESGTPHDGNARGSTPPNGSSLPQKPRIPTPTTPDTAALSPCPSSATSRDVVLSPLSPLSRALTHAQLAENLRLPASPTFDSDTTPD
jgi:hypothetical protein